MIDKEKINAFQVQKTVIRKLPTKKGFLFIEIFLF